MNAFSRVLSPLVILLVGLATTLIATILVFWGDQDRRQARFDGMADAVVSTLEGRLNEQRVLLRGVAAMFHGSGTVSRTEFADYVARLRLSENHPGVLGIGYARLAESADELDAVTDQAIRNGVSGFRPWPAHDQFPVSAIVYLEPLTAANQRAVGFDMYGERVRHEAMAKALETGEAALSGKVHLVQDEGRADAAGFLLYVPIGANAGARSGTSAATQAGWAYSPLRARELFGAALARADLADAAVEVFDGTPEAGNLLFRSDGRSVVDPLTTDRVLRFAGRPWTVRVSTAPGFFADAPFRLGWIVLGGGVLITLLFAALAFQQARAAARTQARVDRATAALRLANDELVAAGRAREEAEAQLRQMQKIEAIGQLTGGIAHDFNNMLAIVMGNLDLAERRVNEPDRVTRAIGAAKQGAVRAADLTRRLLAFSRKQTLEPRTFDPNRLIVGMSDLLDRALEETVHLQTSLADGAWPIRADPGQLENALLNLAVNGRDAMPDGGTLTISTANAVLKAEGATGDLPAGDYVRITVADTGTGMAPEVAARALDPFFTTKEVGMGTGLGLSQVFGFVKQSGGNLTIRSTPGEGTTVEIWLPRAAGALSESEATAVPAALPHGNPGELIIVAEDEEGVRETTVETLRELGYSVLHASDGAHALTLLDRHGGAALLLTDVVMPAMDGRELATRARAAHPELRVLFTTGYSRDVLLQDDGNGDDHGPALLAKPFTTAELASKVREQIDRG